MVTRFVTLGWLHWAVDVPATYPTINTKHDYGRCRSIPIGVRTVARTIGRILSTLIGLAITGFVLLVLIGLWDRHEQEITAGLSRIYERYLASQAGPSSSPRARAAAFQEQLKLVGTGPNNADRDRPAFGGPAGAAWVFTRSSGHWRQQAKLVGTTSEYGGGLWSQGASVAVSAD